MTLLMDATHRDLIPSSVGESWGALPGLVHEHG